MLKLLLSLSLFIYGMGIVMPAGAHDNETLFNTVNLQAQVEREIPNGQMTVALVTEHYGSGAEKVAKLINVDMTCAGSA